jgi:hypothetical protein
MTGTGTLVCWDGMPDKLKGRVVITCAHNHPFFSVHEKKDETQNVKAGSEKLLNTKNDSSRVYLTKANGGVKKFDMHFTPDTSDTFDVWAPGKLSSSIAVERCYLFEDKSGKMSDFAVLILKDAVIDSDGTELYGANLRDIMTSNNAYPGLGVAHPGVEETFTIGYGGIILNHQRPCPIPFVGWNLKKRTRGTTWNEGYGRNFSPVDRTCFGPSDSGSPIVAKIQGNYYVVGVFNGTFDHSLIYQVDRMKAVASYEQRGTIDKIVF